ncbi:MAG: hypothetical protein PHV59_05860 [Victivallales bacterium]|nr:hypothetical protein [Victivallales bacterium]
MNSWSVDDSNIVKNKFKKYQKRHQEDTASVFANLIKLLDFLNSGISFNQTLQNCSYLRSERGHVYRIANKNRSNAHETRLYIYIEEEQKIVYLLGLGDKNTQSLDIKDSHEKVNKIRGYKNG